MSNRLSVILVVFNGMPYLPETVESILGQSFRDFTFIIVDDGSADGTRAYLESLRDDRIVLLHQANAGHGAARNLALNHCQTEYAAITDADDVSLPDRLLLQVEYLDAHPDVVVLGTQIQFIVGGSIQKAFPAPTGHRDIERRFLQGEIGMCHSSMMFRLDAACAAGPYWEVKSGGDTDFSLRLCELGAAANLDKVLLKYRIHTSSISMMRIKEQTHRRHFAMQCAICRRNGVPVPSFDEFINRSSWLDRWRWFLEARAQSQYRTGRIRIATRHPLEGCARLALSGLCRPFLAIRRIAQTVKTSAFSSTVDEHGATTEPPSARHYMSRLRVLAIAYACNPTSGSESGVGWGWVNAIAANRDVTVITADYNSYDINRHVTTSYTDASDHLRFIYIRNRPWHYRPEGIWLQIESSIAKPLMNLAYQNWLRYAFLEASCEINRNEYDLVHLITYVGWRFPGRFYQLGIPFVWGPIGGLINTPWHLFPALGIKGAIYYGGRNIINSLQVRLLCGPRNALRQAHGAVIAATSEIQRALSRHFGSASRVICEVGLPDVASVEPRERKTGEPLRISWSGLHSPGKALHLLLRAAASFPSDMNYFLHILGDGPSNREWRALARRLDINDHCQWYGRLPRDQALAVMQSCHVFVITSLKELTSTVAVEALALGLPIVCLDHCGFADLVTDECGIKVNPGFPSQIACDLADALRRLSQDEPLRLRFARVALKRSKDYSWKSKMDALDELYAMATRRNGSSKAEHAATLRAHPSEANTEGFQVVTAALGCASGRTDNSRQSESKIYPANSHFRIVDQLDCKR